MFETTERSESYQSRTFPSRPKMFEDKPTLPRVTSYGTPVSASGKPLQKVKPQSVPQTPQASSAGFASDITGLNVGSIIAHERFGKGVVQSLEGTGDNAKVEVEFETSGYKKLLLKFARFTLLS
ncbi:MAG: hypothetical protein NTY32_06890, partial [Bacteroidia bacterium]|nr:hypothetical protein [Bacteroidia bacterium]